MCRAQIIFSFALLSAAAKAHNQFWETKANFSFTTPQQVFWADGENTWLTGLAVVGTTDPTENHPLPRLSPLLSKLPLTYVPRTVWEAQCTGNSTNSLGVTICNKWINNGTGTFGGTYASGLKLGNGYHFNLQWSMQDGSGSGNSNSSEFYMLDTPVSSSFVSFSPTTRSLPTTPNQNTQNNIPPGAMVGIVVGSVAIVAMLCGYAYYFLRIMRHRNKKRGEGEEAGKLTNRGGPGLGYGYTSLGEEIPIFEPSFYGKATQDTVEGIPVFEPEFHGTGSTFGEFESPTRPQHLHSPARSHDLYSASTRSEDLYSATPRVSYNALTATPQTFESRNSWFQNFNSPNPGPQELEPTAAPSSRGRYIAERRSDQSFLLVLPSPSSSTASEESGGFENGRHSIPDGSRPDEEERNAYETLSEHERMLLLKRENEKVLNKLKGAKTMSRLPP